MSSLIPTQKLNHLNKTELPFKHKDFRLNSQIRMANNYFNAAVTTKQIADLREGIEKSCSRQRLLMVIGNDYTPLSPPIDYYPKLIENANSIRKEIEIQDKLLLINRYYLPVDIIDKYMKKNLEQVRDWSGSKIIDTESLQNGNIQCIPTYAAREYNGEPFEKQFTVKEEAENSFYNISTHLLLSNGNKINEADALYFGKIMNPIGIKIQNLEDFKNASKYLHLMNTSKELGKVIYILQCFQKDPGKLFEKEGITWMLDPGYDREEFSSLNAALLKHMLFEVYMIGKTFGGIFLNTYPLNKEKMAFLSDQIKKLDDYHRQRFRTLHDEEYYAGIFKWLVEL